MFLVWTGWGPVSILVVGVGLVLGHTVGDFFGLTKFTTSIVGLILGASANWFVGRMLNNPARDRQLIDPKTGEAVLLKHRHTLFWVPIQYWSIIIVIGIAVAIVRKLIG